MTENNMLSLTGTVKEFSFGFMSQKYEEKFFKMILEVPRLSEKTDKLTIYLPERIVYDQDIKEDSEVTVTGQIRSRKWKDDTGIQHLAVYGYATDITTAQDLSLEDKNFVRVEGTIRYPLKVRRSSHYKKVICDIMLEVGREYDKVDVIPCIAWGKDALAISEKCQVGDKISIVGRFQSRNYYKKDTDTYHTVYEVSANTIEVIEDDEKQADNPGNPGVSDTVSGGTSDEQ